MESDHRSFPEVRQIEQLLARGQNLKANIAWRGLRDKIAGQSRWSVCGRIARAFMSNGALREAREVLCAVPEGPRLGASDLRKAWSDLRHMEEAERLGDSVFPVFLDFDELWAGPHLKSGAEKGSSLLAWYPGRVLEAGAAAYRLILGQGPMDGPVELFTATLDYAKLAPTPDDRPLHPIAAGLFIEVHVWEVRGEETTMIVPHPIRP